MEAMAVISMIDNGGVREGENSLPAHPSLLFTAGLIQKKKLTHNYINKRKTYE